VATKFAAGRDYPGSYAEMRAWFDEDWKCLDYLDWLSGGEICPRHFPRVLKSQRHLEQIEIA
jgi:hypothetical protein